MKEHGYKFVGAAYVDEVMYGELVRGEAQFETVGIAVGMCMRGICRLKAPCDHVVERALDAFRCRITASSNVRSTRSIEQSFISFLSCFHRLGFCCLPFHLSLYHPAVAPQSP